MLLRYLLLLVVFNIVHSAKKHQVLNKIPVNVKPLKLFGFKQSNQVSQNESTNEIKLKLVASKKDDGNSTKQDAGDDGEKDANENNTDAGQKDKEEVVNDDDGKTETELGKQRGKPGKKSEFLDDLLERYHPEKVNNMEDDISTSWPLGVIPYHFDTSSFDDILAARVRDAMDLLERSSCLQFRALSGKTPAHNWIHITNPWKQRDCSHMPKRKSSGEIVLILGLDCLKQRDIIHSLLHAIGFSDEVTHPHRDQYVRIMWENIQPSYQRLFSLIPRHKKMLVEYDPMSIMHFHDRAFSKNGQATISVLMPGLQIQPSDKLSPLDKMRLRLAFGHECNRRTVDKLFDTCKMVLHNAPPDDDGVKEFETCDLPHKDGKAVDAASKREGDADKDPKQSKAPGNDESSDKIDPGSNRPRQREGPGDDESSDKIDPESNRPRQSEGPGDDVSSAKKEEES